MSKGTLSHVSPKETALRLCPTPESLLDSALASCPLVLLFINWRFLRMERKGSEICSRRPDENARHFKCDQCLKSFNRRLDLYLVRQHSEAYLTAEIFSIATENSTPPWTHRLPKSPSSQNEPREPRERAGPVH